MNWLERAKMFEENKVYATDVITCKVLTNAYKVGDKDDYNSWTISPETFEILASYINGWLCETVCEYQLASYLLDALMLGLRRNDFTLDDIECDNYIVRDYINDMI